MVPPCREQVVNNSRLYSFPSNWENDPETGFEEMRKQATFDEHSLHTTGLGPEYVPLARHPARMPFQRTISNASEV